VNLVEYEYQCNRLPEKSRLRNDLYYVWNGTLNSDHLGLQHQQQRLATAAISRVRSRLCGLAHVWARAGGKETYFFEVLWFYGFRVLVFFLIFMYENRKNLQPKNS